MKRKTISLLLALGTVLALLSVQCAASTKAKTVSAGLSAQGVSVLLGRPTETEMSVSVTPADGDCAVFVEWGGVSGSYTQKSGELSAAPERPAVFTLTGLTPNAKTFYRVGYRPSGAAAYTLTPEYDFQMPRAAGSAYSFVVQSDSHLLNKADPALYAKSLQSMAALDPDFMFDLGDTFLNDQVKTDPVYQKEETLRAHYTQQLPYFSLVASGAPLYLTMGNHEGEYGHFLDGTDDNLAAMATLLRKTYYENPVPNDFYTGNTETEDVCGQPENYYAFTWGDALYVSIDPYRYTTADPYDTAGGWDWTLGKTQYDWFKKTLGTSTAKYKFVFSHHAIGNFRGGAELASLYEWGGYDRNGAYLFDKLRPGWGEPVQKIMEDAGVTIFFQGHDHLFAREVVNGVVYQTLPKPAESVADRQSNPDAYPDADVLANSGFLHVSVGDEGVQVDYVRSYDMLGEAGPNPAAGVVYSYRVDASHRLTQLSGETEDFARYGVGTPLGAPGAQTEAPAAGTAGKTKKSSAVSAAAEGAAASAPVSFGGSADGDFTFDIQADSHLDENTVPALYAKTLSYEKADAPAFVMDLGDTFMAEKLTKTYGEAVDRFALQKQYLAALDATPLFLVNGNHDGEQGWVSSQTPAWTQALREEYFPNPLLYVSGFSPPDAGNYYAFTRGGALFVVLDPYAFTTVKRQSDTDGWDCTLGKTQYDWLARTLAGSDEKYKFVFVHNLVGGIGKDSRGGMEAAQFFEWGGKNADGSDGWAANRPGWDLPIHALLVKYGVTAVFHGHDHFYARQEKDGIVYQMVPQPGTPGNSIGDAAAFGYESGTLLPSAGYLRVRVAPAGVTVAYVKLGETGAAVADSYTIGS